MKDSDLIKAVESYKGKIQWARIAAEFKEDSEKLRSRYRVISGKSHKARAEKAATNKFPKKEITDAQMLSALKVKRTPQQDADILHMPITEFARKSDKLLSDGYNIREANNLIWLETAAVAESNEIKEDYDGETEIIFGLIGDTHLCNKFQQLTYLDKFYDLCADIGIKTIYHAGDISDGFYKNRPEHIYELFKIGFDEQADYIIQNYPKRNGIVTKFITGNHDATHIKNGGSDIGSRIADKRDDMDYLGYMSAKIWLTPQCDMDLLHPLDGTSYALSYQLQKHIDGLQGGQKPRILACGHWHKGFYMLYRNIHAFAVPCFEAQTNFERGKHIGVTVGGWIIKLSCKPDGTITSINPTLIPYYDMMEHDY